MKKVLVLVIALFCLVGVVNAQKMAISVQPALTMPMGTFGDFYKTGFGGLATFAYTINPNLAIIGGSGYLTWTHKQSSDVTFSTIPVIAGTRYYFMDKGFQPYGTAFLGMFFSNAKIGSYSSSGSNFGFGFGGGFLYTIGTKMALDVTATYNSIGTEGITTSFLAIAAGLQFGLN